MSLTRRITECDLNKLRSEHDAYEDMARHCAKSRVPSQLRLADAPGCRGDSCRQGRVQCRENCNPPAGPPEEDQQPDAIDTVGSIAVTGLVALLAVFAVLGYVFGPEIVSLVRQFG